MSKKEGETDFIDFMNSFHRQKIGDVVDRVRYRHTGRFEPVEDGIDLREYRPIAEQLNLLGFNGDGKFKHVAMGDFYEMITRAFYGGNIGEKYKLKDERRNLSKRAEKFEDDALDFNMEEWDDDPFCHAKPDVVNGVRGTIFESKSCKVGSHCNFLDGQVWRYETLQYQLPQSRISFAIYRHRFEGIKKFDGSDEELFEGLAGNTVYSVMMPLSLVMSLHSSYENLRWNVWNSLVRRHDPKGDKAELVDYTYRGYFPPCTCVKTRAIDALLVSPRRVMEVLERDPEKYDVRRFNTPEGFKIGGFELGSFPIVSIRDKFHGGWVEGFKEEYEAGLKKKLDEVPF
jgi:hypothetical protein